MFSSCLLRGAFARLVVGPILLLAGTAHAPLRSRACEPAESQPYDPDVCKTPAGLEILELNVHDQSRNRDIPLRVMLPSPPSPTPSPVILFSHGLGGSRRSSEYLGTHWAAHGYAAVFPQHSGSDDAVCKNVPVQQRRAALARAASPKNARDRLLDIHAVLDALEDWASEDGHPLGARLDLTAVGMSGHSFGAVTTQALSGQSCRQTAQGQCDLRIRAAIAMSPSTVPRRDLQLAFGSVRIPWLMMTGSKDYAPLGYLPPQARRDVFNHLPKAIDRYELVLGGAHHFAFTAGKLPATIEDRNAHHHKTIQRLSTAFWDAYLRQDPAAKQWLQGMALRSTLDAGDRWRIGIAGH